MKNKLNKKGGTFQIWLEVILFIFLFIAVIGIIGLDMNEKYGQSHDLSLGLNLSGQLSELKGYKTDVINSTTQGQASISDFGIIKLLTVPTMLMQAIGILWNFVNGSFIYALISHMNLGVYGSYIAIVFQVLYVLAVLFILIKLVLRINP